jgi:hypothetical protein
MAGGAHVSHVEFDRLSRGGATSAISLYCMTALVADEASRSGQLAFAKSMEEAMADLLSNMPREQQKQALRIAYEMALGKENPAPPRLRLVYSRD